MRLLPRKRTIGPGSELRERLGLLRGICRGGFQSHKSTTTGHMTFVKRHVRSMAAPLPLKGRAFWYKHKRFPSKVFPNLCLTKRRRARPVKPQGPRKLNCATNFLLRSHCVCPSPEHRTGLCLQKLQICHLSLACQQWPVFQQAFSSLRKHTVKYFLLHKLSDPLH